MMIVQWWSIKIHSSFSSGFPAIRYSKTFGSTIDQFCCDVLLHSSTFGGEALRWPEGSLLWVTYEPYGPWIWYTLFQPIGVGSWVYKFNNKSTSETDWNHWRFYIVKHCCWEWVEQVKIQDPTCNHYIYIYDYIISLVVLYISINIMCIYIYIHYIDHYRCWSSLVMVNKIIRNGRSLRTFPTHMALIAPVKFLGRCDHGEAQQAKATNACGWLGNPWNQKIPIS